MQQSINLLPKQKVSTFILSELQKANKNTSNFSLYKKAIKKIFKLNTESSHCSYSTKNHNFFISGFLVGEASINVSAKKNATSKFGMVLDPEFNIAQHINGICYLYAALSLFNTGKIYFKSGSNATFVYKISNRESLYTKIMPFYEKYVYNFMCETHKQRIKIFSEILVLFKEKNHTDILFFKNELLPRWDLLRKQKTQSNESFTSLIQAQLFVDAHVFEKKCKKKSSETTRDNA
jgi:hypothetical protein|uniref:LAGLIDADG homing endonuclease n=1 Tax=Prasiola crispa TaxID=173492 RepID=A0A0R8RTB5_PRACR|nr:LAGLIDADG homing endonuclease [Prasiola crispa]